MHSEFEKLLRRADCTNNHRDQEFLSAIIFTGIL